MNFHNRTLEDWQAAHLYRQNPGLGADPRTYCPTCLKTGTYAWGGQTHECDCYAQLNMHKHYLWAGIGTTFQRLDWSDYHGDPEALRISRRYLEEDLHRRGVGLFFMGQFGTGKTMLHNLILKDLVKAGISCFATTFDSMMSLSTGGDPVEREAFFWRVKNSQALLLDDVGKSMRASAAARNFHESTFDEILRPRVHNGLATLVNSNMNEEEIKEGYGAGILSLLRRNAISYTFTGTDFGPEAATRTTEELLRGEIRPIC